MEFVFTKIRYHQFQCSLNRFDGMICRLDPKAQFGSCVSPVSEHKVRCHLFYRQWYSLPGVRILCTNPRFPGVHRCLCRDFACFHVFFRLGVVAQLFGKIDILNGKQSEDYVIVQRFGVAPFRCDGILRCAGLLRMPQPATISIHQRLLLRQTQETVLLSSRSFDVGSLLMFEVFLLPSVCLVPFLLSVV